MRCSDLLLRRICLIGCEVVSLFTAVVLLLDGEYSRLPLALFTLILVWMPRLAEVVLHCRLHPLLYLLGSLYTLGPMAGQCWGFYYATGWWDKLLHICGGVLFAVLGVYLCRKLGHGQSGVLLCAVFALSLSIAVSAVWEFVEFGSDRLLHTDMQRDSVVTAIYSYDLGDAPGVVGHVESIQGVLVNGQPLPEEGYLDIGLIDTMTDMMLESLGAAVFCAAYLLDRGKHPLILDQAS